MTKYDIIDCHMDSLVSGYRYLPRPFHKKTDIGHIDKYRLKEGGVKAVFFAVFPASSNYLIAQGVDMWFKAVEDERNDFFQIRKFEDLKEAKKRKKVGAILHFEGSGGLDSEFVNLRNYYRMGLRSMGITWSNFNRFGTGVTTYDDRGLTAEGKELVAEMNKMGIIVDVSHINEKSFWDVVDVTKKPFIASHSNAYTICDHPRNLKDDQLQAIKDADGIIGLNLCVAFLKSGAKKGDNITFEMIKNHVDHIMEVAGIDHMALGSDFDGTSVPDIVKDVSYYPKLLDYLEANGYSEEDLQKITHKNIERVMKNIWH